jgi:Cytochrome C oxidase, cbb3-type, subunit III
VLGLDIVGLNCAVCHTGSVRATAESARQIVLGMPSNTVDLQAYFEFLFACAGDGGFTVDAVMERIRSKGGLDWYERLLYPRAIREFREKALAQKKKVSYWEQTDKYPKFGPGRVDTFNPYKVLFFNANEVGDWVGTADFPSLWNQGRRKQMNLHWDGNNNSVRERNISAAIGAGVVAPNDERRTVRPTLDEKSMARIADWILEFGPPAFPGRIDEKLAKTGAGVFNIHCASCHSFTGKDAGQVTKLTDEKLRTDAHRLNSFTPEMVEKMNTWGEGHWWAFSHFHKTDGYANSPLDGIWLRGPYLHNGSVRTLRQLLYPSERREILHRGTDVYDWEGLGFADIAAEGERKYFKFNTQLPGNSNHGHTYGAELSDGEKTSLLEYLKTL